MAELVVEPGSDLRPHRPVAADRSFETEATQQPVGPAVVQVAERGKDPAVGQQFGSARDLREDRDILHGVGHRREEPGGLLRSREPLPFSGALLRSQGVQGAVQVDRPQQLSQLPFPFRPVDTGIQRQQRQIPLAGPAGQSTEGSPVQEGCVQVALLPFPEDPEHLLPG